MIGPRRARVVPSATLRGVASSNTLDLVSKNRHAGYECHRLAACEPDGRTSRNTVRRRSYELQSLRHRHLGECHKWLRRLGNPGTTRRRHRAHHLHRPRAGYCGANSTQVNADASLFPLIKGPYTLSVSLSGRKTLPLSNFIDFNLTGSGDATVTANSSNDVFDLDAKGNQTIEVGGTGNYTIEGNAGKITLIYSTAVIGVTVNLSTDTVTKGLQFFGDPLTGTSPCTGGTVSPMCRLLSAASGSQYIQKHRHRRFHLRRVRARTTRLTILRTQTE